MKTDDKEVKGHWAEGWFRSSLMRQLIGFETNAQ
jgi:hypothetical protein